MMTGWRALSAIGASLVLWHAGGASAQQVVVPAPDAKQLPTAAIGVEPLPANAPKPSIDPRDLEGIWRPMGAPVRVLKDVNGKEPLYQQRTADILKRRLDMTAAGTPEASPMSFCRPPGFFVNFGLNFPVRIIQEPSETIFLFEEFHSIWRVHMNQPLPAKVPISNEGYSVGRWEGDTLVVDTIGVRHVTWLDIAGTSHSDDMSMRHRFRKIKDGSAIEILTTITDPKAFKAPWTMRFEIAWRPDYYDFAEFNCEESTGSDAEAKRYGTSTERYDADK